MDRLETELQHMLRMLAPPFFNAWKSELWCKAKKLEAGDPEFTGLKAALEREVAQRGWSAKPKTPPSTSPGR